MQVVDEVGERIGEVTSGTFSPTLGVGIALALLDAAHTKDEMVGVLIRDRSEQFEVVDTPFVTPNVRK